MRAAALLLLLNACALQALAARPLQNLTSFERMALFGADYDPSVPPPRAR